MTALAWELSGLPSPAIVIGFGSIPYLPTNLSRSKDAQALQEASLALATDTQQRFGVSLKTTPYFAGISDMSFFGEADEATLNIVSRNTPSWSDRVRWPEKGGIADIPTINLGPWGRDYHTRLERLYAPYAFSVLPRMVTELVNRVLQSEERA
jgi:arginine utilization protein RocB